MTGMAQVRPYRGIEAAERLNERRRRLAEAGLDLLGADNSETELTVRAVCKKAGLTARYFYESFADKDQFVVAVFDDAVADIATTTQAAVAASPRAEQGRAGMANLVRIVSTDSRVGRVLFDVHMSNPVILRKRSELGGIFAFLLAQHLATALRRDQTGRSRAAVHFVVGGVSQTISAWLAGEVDLTEDQLIDQLTAILGALDDPRLYFD
jgi:AcrR family transcriptional regulator